MSKRTAAIRRKLVDGGICAGAWMYLPSPMAAEMVADAGFDYVIIDTEHHPFNLETLFNMRLAFRGSDTLPMVRVPWNDPVAIKQILDMGYEGIVTPQTNTADEVRQAVDAVRYPPAGSRGYGPLIPGRYYRDGGEYARTANDSIICAIQIENVSGANEIDEIVKVPGLDWILVGRYDMSASVGGWCEVEHPELWEAIGKIMAAANNAGIPAGVPLGGPEEIQRNLDLGSKIITIGADCAYLQSSADHALATFRESVTR